MILYLCIAQLVSPLGPSIGRLVLVSHERVFVFKLEQEEGNLLYRVQRTNGRLEDLTNGPYIRRSSRLQKLTLVED